LSRNPRLLPLGLCAALSLLCSPGAGSAQEAAPANPPAAEAPPAAAPAAEVAAPAAPPANPPAALTVDLADPAVGDRLKLTDGQRVQLAALLTERTQALAQAPAEQRPAVLESFQQKMIALLTDEQRADLAKPQSAPRAKGDAKLRFNFRFQRWSDVLEWFASQADLSLVLDAPPPGTFNYSDGRDYTVAEALDLLNGVLLTKGFTLIRRDRMLVVVNLADGVPESLVPRVPLADLDKRGRFELVSVLFPLGNRKVDDVVKEITPLLGPRGKVAALEQTKQVLVTDTAGVMRAIDAVIESIPQPQKPTDQPPEKPELVVYPLKSADPDAAVKVLEALMPTGRFVRDPKSNQLSAFATPSQQAGVKRVLEQMDHADGPADQQARFEVYPLEDADLKQALAALQPLVPGARLSVDPTSKKVAAWGTPADHEILKKAVAQLGQGGGSDDRQVEVYRLIKIEPAAALTTLQSVVPKARLAIDAPTRSIVAVATLADQKAIRATLEQLEPGKHEINAPGLQFYPIAGPFPPTNLVAALQGVAPKAQVTVDTAGSRLMVVATPADHAVIKETIEQFESQRPEIERRQLKLYPVTAAERKRFQLMLTDLAAEFPAVKVLTDAEPGELAIWARPAEHEVIGQIIERLKQQTPAEDAFRLVAYSIKSADPASVLAVLTNLFPSTKLVLDAKSRRLVAWTRPAEQESIRSLIEQMDSDEGGDTRNQLMVYPLSGAEATATMTSLKIVAPDATVVSDAKAGTLIIFARKHDHALIAAALERLRPSADPQRRPHVVSYPVGSGDPATLYPLISSLVPTARVVPNVKNRTIAVWATPEDHETIRAAIEEMTSKKAEASQATVVSYPTGASDPSTLYSMVTTLVPTARAVPNVKNRTIAVWATPEDHETIRAAIEEMTSKKFEAGQATVVSYPTGSSDPTTLYSMVATLVPTARAVPNVKNRTIAVWATPEDHETIRAAIEEMTSKKSEGAQATVVSYPVGSGDPSTLYPLISALVPTARVVPNVKNRTIAVWATAEDHETIRGAIEEMTSKKSDAAMSTVVSYPVGSGDPATLYPLVAALVPTARVVPNVKNGTIAVWATPEEHETIRGAIEEMAVKKSDSAAKVTVYTLKHVNGASILAALSVAAPEARLAVGQDAQTLVVFGKPSDHETIRSALDQLDHEDTGPQNLELKTYPIASAEATTLLNSLQTLFATRRDVRLSLDAKNNRIVAMASAAQQAAIRGVIEEMERGSPLDAQAELQVHPLGNAESDVVLQVVTNLVGKKSRAQFSIDPRARQLIAIATPADQLKVRSTIERLQSVQRQLEVFQLEVAEAPAARVAIEKLFAESGSSRATAPIVEADPSTQRLYVRANREQLDQIRELLVKMGETNLLGGRGGVAGAVRVVPFSGDARAVLEEIQKVWPRLSKTRMRVLNGPAASKALTIPPTEGPLPGEAAPHDEKLDDAPRIEEAPLPHPADPQTSLPRTDKQTRHGPRGVVPEVKTAQAEPAAQQPAAKDPVAKTPAVEKAEQPAPTVASPSDAPAPPAAPAEPAMPREPGAIVVAPGDDRVTIMSDDPEAIQQLESLLRALAPPSAAGGRDLLVYPLTSASSSAVAEMLTRLFRRTGFDARDPVVVEADQRLNAVIVHAGRNDRAAIERLLKSLDSDEIPESLVANRPHMIPVTNTTAARVLLVLKDVYKTQLTSGGIKQQIPIPSGASRDVAAVIQQINTASGGPLMTLGVDDTTNSIVVMAPRPLVKEVGELVQELDEAALHDSSRGVKIVKLKNTSPQRVKEVLDTIIKDAVRRRASNPR